MARINNYGYLERKIGTNKNPNAKVVWRNWWLVKALLRNYGANEYGQINIGNKAVILLPRKYIGKRVRFKIEIMEDEK